MLKRSGESSDPLSHILSLLRPRSIACGAVDAGDDCIAFPAGPGVKCHAVISGEAWLQVDGMSASVRLSAGDCFLLPHGRPYRLATDLALKPTDYRTMLAEPAPGCFRIWNGGGKATVISAAFTVDAHHAGMLLDVLPPIAHIHADPDRAALGRSLEQMLRELREPRPAGRYIVEQLATMLLALALRAYLAQARGGRVGWLFALADK